VSLSRPREFADISEDPKVRDVLKAAYKRPEDVEFYVGLFAEDTIPNSPLPNLVLRMVAVDAFSQALTNPLLSEHVFKESTFSKVGWDAIQTTSRLRDVVDRNCIGGAGTAFIGMTRPDWRPRG
jgi:prostaglandin-endoperoxide synthase 2